MRVVEKSVEALAQMAAPYNPRKISGHDLRALRRSLRRFGCPEPVIVNRRTDRIVGGHQRVRAAQAEGIERLPTVFVDLPEGAERQLNLALNRIHGAFDPEALSGVLADLKEMGEDLRLTGFSDEELSDIFGEEPKGGLTDPDHVPEEAEPRTQPGDLWVLGDHRLFCGDATRANAVQTVKGSESVVALITDPPYGIGVDHGWRDGVKNRTASPRSGKIQNDDRADWHQVYSLVGARVLYIWHAALFGDVVKQGIEASGYEVRQQIVWVKAVHSLGRSAYHWKHETCWYAVRQGKTSGWSGGRKQTTVWEYASPIMTTSHDKEARVHPTQKPTELFEIPIRNHTAEGDAIFDAFIGSGTAFIAAERLGRRCFGLEIDPVFCDIAVTRWEEFTGQNAKQVNGTSR